jgi:hypothetical protein
MCSGQLFLFLLGIDGPLRFRSILLVRAERRLMSVVRDSASHAVSFFALEHCTPSFQVDGIKGRNCAKRVEIEREQRLDRVAVCAEFEQRG